MGQWDANAVYFMYMDSTDTEREMVEGQVPLTIETYNEYNETINPITLVSFSNRSLGSSRIGR